MDVFQLKKDFINFYSRDREPVQVFFAPGRVCLIGEHIDYNGGLVIPAAISLGIFAVARKTSANVLCLKSSISEKEIIVSLENEIVYDASLGWANYPLGMFRYFINKGYLISGCEIIFESTLPAGAGLSSSAAIETLTGFIISLFNYIEISREELALAAKDVENNFIKVQCGIMDQFAVVLGKTDHAIKLDCTSLEYEYLPLLLNRHDLIILNTNKKRELLDSTFNLRVEECAKALQLIQQHESISCLANASIEMVQQYVKDTILFNRAVHVVSENVRVASAAEVLKQGNIEAFGKMLFQSHDSLRDNYEVSGKELDTFIDFAKKFNGCMGAKMTGAGFGGCAIAIVEKEKTLTFMKEILKYYTAATGIEGDAYMVQISDGVRQI